MSSDLLTIIDKNGKAEKGKDPSLPKDELQRLYRLMVTTRLLDERGLALQRQGRIGFYLQSTGQEASHIGAACALQDSDWLFPAYRQPGILLLRSVPLDKVVSEWFGNDGDTSKGRQMPVHYSFREANFVSISSPIGTQLTQAAGAGMAARIRGDDTCFMTFCGDGGTSSNDFHTGLNFAGVMKTATVFVCFVGNGEPGSAEHAVAYGLPHASCDGSDPEATVRTIATARERAASGGGATVVDVKVGDDAASVTRRLAAVLERAGSWTEAAERDLAQTIGRQLDEALRVARASGSAKASAMFEQVFAELPPHLVAQRSSSERSSSERSSSERDRRK